MEFPRTPGVLGSAVFVIALVLVPACGSDDSSGGGSGGSSGAGTGGAGGSAGAGTGGSATGGSSGAGTGGSAGAGTGGVAGGGGACNNPGDWPKMKTTATATDASTCGGLGSQGCFGKAPGSERSACVATCMKGKQGFTDACAACWGDVVDCGIQHCALQCAAPTSAGCISCTDQNCTPAFNTCAYGL